MTVFNDLMLFLGKHSFFQILLYTVLMDTILGVLRAIKEHKFNSCVGIDGAIRKVAMLFSVMFLMVIDSMVQINFLFIIPEKYLQYIGIERLGVCEVFCILYILYEAVSILKNMALCGLPIPTKVKKFLVNFLDDMTDELPEEASKNLNALEGDVNENC